MMRIKTFLHNEKVTNDINVKFILLSQRKYFCKNVLGPNIENIYSWQF